MVRQVAPRAAAWVLALVIGLGLALRGMPAAYMSAKMVLASESGAAMADGCDMCSGDDTIPMAACYYAVCGGSSSVAVLPAAMAVKVIVADHAPSPLVQSDPGCCGPPDPYPPKPALLS